MPNKCVNQTVRLFTTRADARVAPSRPAGYARCWADENEIRMTDQRTEIEIVAYDPTWPAAFEAEAVRLWSTLQGVALRIDHHGSTSIPGLSAKPVIDIQISVPELQPLATYGERLEILGYVHVPSADDAFSPFFHRPVSWPHSHHVHVVARGGRDERRTLAFRDYLRDHVDDAREYERLKSHLAGRFAGNDPESREAYANAKTDFIAKIVAVALSSEYPRELGRRA